MLPKINIQYLLSYLGLIPYIIILIDKYFFFQIKEQISINFLIYYTLIILVFIGSLNWDLESKIKKSLVIYGFIPSLFSTVIIVLNLYNLNINYLILLLITLLLLQVLFDYFFIYSNKFNKDPFFFLRLPLTIAIIFLITIIRL